MAQPFSRPPGGFSGSRASAPDQNAGKSGLQRFVDAQDAGGVFEAAVRELRQGHKQSHWMWFVFPQLAGLGRSATAQHFAIAGLAEAQAYLAHPVLGPRLIGCAELLLALDGSSPADGLGDVDAQKLKSCMTLFARAAPDEPVFCAVLDRYFRGRQDDATTSGL